MNITRQPEAKINRAEALVKEAEKATLLVHRPQGELLPSQLYNHYEINDVYCQIGSHVKDSMCRKIECGQYINLAKLLTKRKSQDDDEKLEVVNKNGRMYFLPASETDSIKINNFEKWEEAFRIYASIYTKANPHRTIEIFQHIDNIKGATADFTSNSES